MATLLWTSGVTSSLDERDGSPDIRRKLDGRGRAVKGTRGVDD